jgi:hypothetical protein
MVKCGAVKPVHVYPEPSTPLLLQFNRRFPPQSPSQLKNISTLFLHCHCLPFSLAGTCALLSLSLSSRRGACWGSHRGGVLFSPTLGQGGGSSEQAPACLRKATHLPGSHPPGSWPPSALPLAICQATADGSLGLVTLLRLSFFLLRPPRGHVVLCSRRPLLPPWPSCHLPRWVTIWRRSLRPAWFIPQGPSLPAVPRQILLGIDKLYSLGAKGHNI